MVSALILSNGLLQTTPRHYGSEGPSDLFLRKTGDFEIIAPVILPNK
jgi:hypothetical protein